MRLRSLHLAVLFGLALSACAGDVRLAQLAPPPASIWAFEKSDLPVDPAWRFGRLSNGMRYVIRQNATPKGTALVRMEVAAGSLDEAEHERGYAHFVEHMAFNGSTRVPEGEMVRLLERNGLAFGADTNAQTGFQRTTYLLDLPEAKPALLDTALMLMRETASELIFAPEAVERERGVILAERRDRDSPGFRNLADQLSFTDPQALYPRRLAIGTTETISAATASDLKAFWQREYVPDHVTIVVVGDFAPDAVETAIRAQFGDWERTGAAHQPPAGPVRAKDVGRTAIYVEQALSERVTATRKGPRLDEPDTAANRQEELLRQIGYGIVNRRFQRAGRLPDPPFRAASFDTGDLLKAGRATELAVDTVDRKWPRGFAAAIAEYRRAMEFGFTSAEVAEQLAVIRKAARNEAELAGTRSNGALISAAFSLLRDERVPTTPQSALERFESFAPRITPETVLAALKREAVPLKDPLIRFQGRYQPEGGGAALRAAWDRAMRSPLQQTDSAITGTFGYTDFGRPGAVVTDAREPQLGIRRLRFANGVRLNLRHTDNETDRVIAQFALDGGGRLSTKANPLATEMVSAFVAGGLGKHSQDDLQSLLSDRSVAMAFSANPEVFGSTVTTTTRDLETELQLMAAYVTDPGYRPEGQVQYRLAMNNYFAQLRTSPGSALGASIGGILSDDDPRFMLHKVEDYRALTFAKLKADLADRLDRGAIEIGIVGDIDEAQAIALTAKTFGALPTREAEFGRYPEQRQRPFTANRSLRVLRHTGPKDQALLQLVWPTRDDSDAVDNRRFAVLDRVVGIVLNDTLREQLGKAYSPNASSNLSQSWDDYGTFSITASVDVKDVAATRAAILAALGRLRDAPVSEDLLQRARQPLLEAYDNQLKTNRGWIGLVARAQSEPDRLDRFVKARARLLAITPAELQELARKYLADTAAVPVLVLPEAAAAPAN